MKTPTTMKFSLLFLLLLPLMGASQYEPPDCGDSGAPCPDGMCCSQWGYCGSSDAYCASENCVSQCPLDDTFSKELFEEFLPQRNNEVCPARGFFTYEAFIEAAKAFPSFGTTGIDTIRKREIAAFLAQSSEETTGGWPGAPGGQYAWGYCFKAEVGPHYSDYCVPDPEWPCVPGKKYYPRGPLQLAYNYNYGRAGQVLGLDLLSNPDFVATDPVVAFKTAIWFWMSPQATKPSCHDVVIGAWEPTLADIEAGRFPGYGMLTNIITSGFECGGRGSHPLDKDRVQFYKRYCHMFEISPGDNLYCMEPYGLILNRASV